MRINAFVTTTALACVLLAGCTDDPVGPVDGDTSAPTTAASPTPTGPTPPPLPDAAKADTTAGAVAFVEHYIELLNYAANTGDVAPLRAAATNCEGCEGYAALYDRVYDAGGFYRTAGWKPTDVTWNEIGSSVGVSMTVDAPPATYRETRTGQTVTTKGAEYALILTASKEGGKWQLISLRDGS